MSPLYPQPPTPEADYPEYSHDNIDVYPEADYGGHYIPPPPQQAPADGQISGWSCQIKDGQKLYVNSSSGETVSPPPPIPISTPTATRRLWDRCTSTALTLLLLSNYIYKAPLSIHGAVQTRLQYRGYSTTTPKNENSGTERQWRRA